MLVVVFVIENKREKPFGIQRRMLRIRDVPALNLGPESDYPKSNVYDFPTTFIHLY
jgi:hypothetical protein